MGLVEDKVVETSQPTRPISVSPPTASDSEKVVVQSMIIAVIQVLVVVAIPVVVEVIPLAVVVADHIIVARIK